MMSSQRVLSDKNIFIVTAYFDSIEKQIIQHASILRCIIYGRVPTFTTLIKPMLSLISFHCFVTCLPISISILHCVCHTIPFNSHKNMSLLLMFHLPASILHLFCYNGATQYHLQTKADELSTERYFTHIIELY